MSARIALRKVSSKNEKKFLKLARASKEFHQDWVSVPMTPKAFQRYAKTMNTSQDKSFLVWRKDKKTLAGV